MKTNNKAWNAKPENETTVNSDAKRFHNLIIVDESGSMSSLYNAALTGMNETINTIKASAEKFPNQPQEVTLVTFDTSHYNKIFDSTPVDKTRELTTNDYRPCGGTPLYDAMGKALTELEPKVKENEAVLVTIITDGYENASSEYSLQAIRALVERLDEKGWLFSYIGANQNSAEVGKSMGISDTLDFQADEHSMAQMWKNERASRMDFYQVSACNSFEPKKFARGTFFKK